MVEVEYIVVIWQMEKFDVHLFVVAMSNSVHGRYIIRVKFLFCKLIFNYIYLHVYFSDSAEMDILVQLLWSAAYKHLETAPKAHVPPKNITAC